MTALFSKVLNMSLTASIIILCVMAVRLLLKKAPKIYAYALWAVVLFRLLCPVSLSAPMSLLGLTGPEVTVSQGAASTVTYLPLETSPKPQTFHRAETVSETVITPPAEREPLELLDIACILWVAGIAVMSLYSIAVYARLRACLVGAMPYRGNVYLADYISSPFVLGLIRPRIYLPSNTPKPERRCIIAHECHHIRRGDHIVKLLAYAALCIHWFNPLVWTAFLLAGKDMEMRCDEAVIRKLGSGIQADYSESLLRLATHRTIIAGTPLSFGEGDTRGRVLNMAKWKKPKVWVSILCLILCVTVLVVCAVNPKEEKSLGDMTRASGPVEIGKGNLYFILPEGYTYELTEEQTSSTSLYNSIIKAGDTVVGGVDAWDTPSFALEQSTKKEGVYQEGNYAQWVKALGLPEAQGDPSITSMISYTNDGVLEAEFWNAQDPKVMDEYHYFFVDGDLVYDMWFERNLISEADSFAILNTAVVENRDLYTFTPRGVQDASYYVTAREVPDGYTCEWDRKGNAVFTDGDNTVGGVDVYAIPDGVYDPEDDVWLWLEDVGIPDFEDPGLTYVGGITAVNGGWKATFESTADDGAEPAIIRDHHFYVVGANVYDIWLDMVTLDYDTAHELCDAVTFSGASATVEDAPQTSHNLKYTMPEMPEGITYDQQNNTVRFFSGGKTIGGIDHYGVPEWAGDSYDPYSDWEKLDIPDVKDETLCHMGGSSDFGDWEIRFESDVPPGTEKTVDRLHTFFVIEKDLYDVWFDMMQINNTARKEILQALTGEEEPLHIETKPLQGSPIQINAVLYQNSFTSDDGTVTININTAIVPEELEVENGVSLKDMQAAMEQEFKSSDVDGYGLDTTAMGYVGAKCEINVTRIVPGDYLITETEAVPTMEVYGTRKYIFADGDELGEEMGDIHLMTINARNCEILNVFGRKD